MEVIDRIQQSRYRRTDADDAADNELEGGTQTTTASGRYHGGMNDLVLTMENNAASNSNNNASDDISFAGSDLEGDLERELTRRALRSVAKKCIAGAALIGIVVAILASGKGHRLSLRTPAYQPQRGDPPVNNGDDDDAFPILDDDPLGLEDNEDAAGIIITPEEIQDEIHQSSVPRFKICPPPIKRDRPDTQKDSAVFHMGQFKIVPEDTSQDQDDAADSETTIDDAYNRQWQYKLSDMDVSADASIIALGLDDYSDPTTGNYAVGMVRTFAYSCDHRGWKRLGQDLLGENQYEMYGHRVSSSGDGRVLAISAPQRSYDDGKGFVEVYFLNDESNKEEMRWEKLGSRIDTLEDEESEYYMLGHAVDLSDRGETLAILGIVEDEYDNPSYVTRVFDYDYRKKEWKRKGHDLILVNVTFGAREYSYEYSPQVSLSEKGDKLIVTDPQMGVVTYHFHFGLNHWKQEEARTPKWNDDLDKEYWISSLDLDDTGDLVAFSAFEEEDNNDGDGGTTIVNAIKIVDFHGNASAPSDIYARNFRDYEVGLSVSVSDDGSTAAFVASKIDEDDADWWVGYEYGEIGEDVVGALTVLTKYDGEESWSVVGKGTEAEGLGVSGSFVSLSGDGRIAAVGYDTVVSLYGISQNRPVSNGAGGNLGVTEKAGTTSGVEVAATEHDDSKTPPAMMSICDPFPNGTSHDGLLGSIDDLPQAQQGEDQHTLSLSLSETGSIVAVGIDSYDGEDRGLVRTFAWSCEEGRYVRLGRDLLGSHEFDGFGQTVDLSADGTTLAVGANQPPPGKAGYVDVYELRDDDWTRVGDRIREFPKGVSDIGRGVHLSDDGQTLMILGSIVLDEFESSFLRVVRNNNGKWVSMGDDIGSSIEYDDYGTSAHATLSGDGNALAVTGSYSQFLAKLYRFDEGTSNWAETIIPPLNSCADTENESETMYDDDYGLDWYYDCYFSGEDIAMNGAATFLAIAGTSYENSGAETGTVRVLAKDPTTGNFTISQDPIDLTNDYFVSSVDISDDGQHLAVGINDHSDDLEGQGQGLTFAAMAANQWTGVGKVDGTDQTDFLGARVRITGNGRIAAASSRRGYISFFVAA
eukprot:CAMPEP_0183715798 /NCGR_PEP_ID=MMETSP0737-20130205/9897_1 /TAXON_ID=385413 /ORGANISM="Thalassiosira miniscula, Strain CCMP1093" /LENGTH=1093 /DNA_ID=CAMNT_0025944953 /DNA_START=135 /DNA_END=3416 /DNA_ORIENTATION=-